MNENEDSAPKPGEGEAGVRHSEEARPGGKARFFTAIGRREFGALLALLAVSAGLWAFVQFAGRVMDGSMRDLDKSLLLAMREPGDSSDPVGPGWVETMARDITALGGIAILTRVTIASAIFLALQRKTGAMRLLLFAVIGGWGLMVLLKRGFDRPRPDLVAHDAVTLAGSFPSGHAMMAAVTWLTLAVLIGRVESGRWIKAYLLGVAAAVTFAVGVSRVYLGMHWPSDVIAGWALGFMWATLCWLLARWLQGRGKVEPEPVEGGLEPAPQSANPTVNP